jgi:hypothetical protein
MTTGIPVVVLLEEELRSAILIGYHGPSDLLVSFSIMKRFRTSLLFVIALHSLQANDVPLRFSRLDLTDGRKLKDVVVKSYDAKSERLLLVAEGKAMMVPIGVVPPPYNEQLKAAPASGGSVNTITPPARPIASAAEQYQLQRSVPVPAQRVYVPQAVTSPRPAPVDPMLAQRNLQGHQDAAHARAVRYYRYEHQMGSNSIIVQSVSLEVTAPTAVPGWTGRDRTDGKAYIEFFDSKGRSFQRTTSTFEVTTEQKPGEALQVVDFSRKS